MSSHCRPLRPPGPSSVTLLKKYGPEVPFLPLIKVIVMPDAQSQPKPRSQNICEKSSPTYER